MAAADGIKSQTQEAIDHAKAAGDTVIVNYPAGLGTSVPANFKGADSTTSPSATVTLQQNDSADSGATGLK